MSRSLAEYSGHYFLVELAEGAAEGIGARALEILGRGARLLSPEEAEVQNGTRRRGEPWVTAEEARALSYVEGRMVGIRVATAVASEAGLTAQERERLAEAVREEMFAHIDRIYAGLAAAGRFFEEWPQIAARVAARCEPWLARQEVSRLTSALVRHFATRRPGH